jgi:galactokinase
MDLNKIVKTFKSLFSLEPALYQSPGRINLIGEHTDYNDGFVLPAGIDRKIVLAIQPNGSESSCRAHAYDLEEDHAFEIGHTSPIRPNHWSNYIMGVVDQMIRNGAKLKGFDCVISGNVPLGAGLSSSAALESVVAYALNDLFESGFERTELVKMAQKAEHEYAGVLCGIMDQFASVMSIKDQVFRLDCRTLDYEYFPLELGDYELLLLNTNVKHALASSEYNTRRLECETGVSILQNKYPGISNLRDVTIDMLENSRDDLPQFIYRRCRYVVEENQRVLDTCEALVEGNLIRVGELLYESHHGLSQDYEVSCPELDFLVERTLQKDYVLGARMMGGGFGGCTLNIVKRDKITKFIESVSTAYYGAFEKALTPIEVSIEQGSSKINISDIR